MLCAANEDVTVWATQRAHALSAWHKGIYRHHRLRGCGRYPAASFFKQSCAAPRVLAYFLCKLARFYVSFLRKSAFS